MWWSNFRRSILIFLQQQHKILEVWIVHENLMENHKKQECYFRKDINLLHCARSYVLQSRYEALKQMSPSRSGSSHRLSWKIFSSARLVTFLLSARYWKMAITSRSFDFRFFDWLLLGLKMISLSIYQSIQLQKHLLSSIISWKLT